MLIVSTAKLAIYLFIGGVTGDSCWILHGSQIQRRDGQSNVLALAPSHSSMAGLFRIGMTQHQNWH